MRVPPESRMVVKRFPSGTLPLPVGEVASSEEGEEGQITATSIGKCWHLRRQMTSRGRKALSVTCGDSSPKGRAKASYIGTRNGAYLYRYAPFTILRLPLNARAARKSDGRKTLFRGRPATSIGKCWHLPCPAGQRPSQSPAVTALPKEAKASYIGGNGAYLYRQITATPRANRKMLAPSQADDVPRGQRPSQNVTCGDSSPSHLRWRAKASYIGTRNGAYLYRYAPFTVLRLPLNARAARKSDGRKTVSVPAPLASPCGRGGQRSEDGRGQITAERQSENAGTFAGR